VRSSRAASILTNAGYERVLDLKAMFNGERAGLATTADGL